jgi:diguanylate cyclase (GGDEF)-like protein
MNSGAQAPGSATASTRRTLASDAAQFGAEYRFRRADGSFAHVAARGYIIRDENGCALRTVGAIQDLTERQRAEEKIRWSATHDPLTELPNRLLFQERLAGAIHSAHASGTKLALLHLDLDHFKQVNDAIGHDAGDLLLKTFAQRLREVVRAGDTVARLGGDEFAVILRGVRTEAELTPLVASILERIKEPFVYASRILDCRASIGASLYPEHGADPDELLRNADAALYMAKAGARGGLELFRQSMRAELQKRESMVSIARDAVRNERIVPFYQPKIELRTGTHSGLEALLRWRHPGRGGIQLPATISAAFEDLDVAAEISDRMIAAAIVDMRRWLDAGIDFGHVAVNASAAEFRRGDFGESVLERLSQAGVPTRYFQLEVTETVFLGRGAEHVESALKLLSMSGVRIALDDFGTGYASLRHLKQFPVDVIKIDRSFVAGMEEEPDSFAIVRAVINLGRSLNIEVVAEGVETPDQCRRLQSLGCDYGQGFLFSRPRCAEQIAGFIATWSPDALAAQTRPPVPAAGGGTITWMDGWRPGERRLTL